jgi:type I restriction enzyme S subunit
MMKMMNNIKLGEITEIYNGNSINEKIKAEKYSKKIYGWNYIATKDIGFDCAVNYDTGVIIPFTETSFKTAPADCVFVCSEGGSAGKKTAYITKDVCFGNKLYAIIGNKSLLNKKYIFYYTRYRRFYEQFTKLMNGIIGGVSTSP